MSRQTCGSATVRSATSIIALPYYFFRSRGFKHGALATAVMLLAIIFFGALEAAGQYTAYHVLQR